MTISNLSTAPRSLLLAATLNAEVHTAIERLQCSRDDVLDAIEMVDERWTERKDTWWFKENE